MGCGRASGLPIAEPAHTNSCGVCWCSLVVTALLNCPSPSDSEPLPPHSVPASSMLLPGDAVVVPEGLLGGSIPTHRRDEGFSACCARLLRLSMNSKLGCGRRGCSCSICSVSVVAMRPGWRRVSRCWARPASFLSRKCHYYYSAFLERAPQLQSSRARHGHPIYYTW